MFFTAAMIFSASRVQKFTILPPAPTLHLIPFADSRLSASQSIEAVLSEAKSWHQQEHFDAIITTDEASVVATAIVAEALGLPGVSLPGARNSRNKYLMRQSHQRGGEIGRAHV